METFTWASEDVHGAPFEDVMGILLLISR
uniref:Uncharacterized protein n=1 Tax=Anguilla anguilla TaxID=7936 RepID=A0A0E9SEC1_ANGAN